MAYISEMSNSQIVIVDNDGRAVCFIPYLHPESENIKTTILEAFNKQQ